MKNLVLVLLFITTSLLAAPVESTLSYQGNVFSYFASHSLIESNEKIEQLIIVVHGSERNADVYYKSVAKMAGKLGKTESTFIISPHFKLQTDSLLPLELAWTDESWLRGDESLVNKNVSSFEVIDHFIEILGNKLQFPNLKKIVVTGHSAGGQLTQRFAVGSQIEANYQDIQFRYVVANPGSYVYLTIKRPLPISSDNSCAFNNYKYGLDNLNAYMGQLEPQGMIERYIKRDVIYLVGENDVISEDIDQECPAQLQGLNRFIRGYNFKQVLDEEFPENLHEIYTVPGVGHTQYGVYTSEIGVQTLFSEDKINRP